MSTLQARPMPAQQIGERVLLVDGTAVDSCDPRWAAELLSRQKHVWNMRSLDRRARGNYLNDVERAEGYEAATRLAKAYVADWERRKAELKPFEHQAHDTPRYA
jgi:hypothetical protein